MKGFLLLSDAARPHPDGTFSLLRGGIDRVYAPPGKPIRFRGTLVARVVGIPGEAGDHDFKVRFVDQDGHSIVPELKGRFRIPEGGGAAAAIVELDLVLPGYGPYTVSLAVRDRELDSWEVRAVEAQSATQRARVP